MSDHVIRQGVTCSIRIPNIRDANGTLINPAGCSVRGQIRSRAESPTVLHEWTSVGPSANAVITTGQVDLLLTPAVTSAWTWTSAAFDVELTDGDNQIDRIDSGHIVVSREVTR